ncbi:phage major capsid protein [Metabacillus idriensis]|uniref:phage major capsid protein n=1 Tax=Metabacillus idriensis TaxID=324768 RepID=UPI00174E2597|nr:phage major capsid protein [Metabacillus idriensis]
MKMELRVQDAVLLSENQNEMIVSGYVNKTEQLSEVLGSAKKFREKIRRGAFQRNIAQKKRDIDFLLEHKSDQILASTRNESLQLEEDSVGLKMTAKIAKTTYGKDSYELIKSGILRNMSFGFRTIKDSWISKEPGLFERTIEELELFEVSVVKDPAYATSSIAARSIEIVEEPEVKDVVYEDEELRISKLKIQIMRQEDEVRRAKYTLGIVSESNKPVFKDLVKREVCKLNELNQVLTKLEQRNQEETEMKNEERTLTGTTNGSSVISKSVESNIVEKLESTSSVYAKTRKIPFKGEDLKVAYETDLEDATFVNEGEDITEINLNIDNFAVLTQKRVGLSMSFSKNLMLDSGVDLSQHVKNLLIRRVGKAIEKSILSGTAANEFKGIAPDSSVPSEDVQVSLTVLQLRNVFLAVHDDYVKNSVWYMSRPFFEKVSVLTSADNEHYVKHVVVDGKVITTLFGHQIEISDALDAGDTIGQVPVVFGSIEDCYTIGVSEDLEVKVVDDSIKALQGSVGIVADFYGDGRVTNYQAVARGVVA